MSLLSRRRLWSLFEALFRQELTPESTQADSPDWIRTSLLPHQRACLHAALALEHAKCVGLTVDPVPGESTGGQLFTSHGILADSVGSGKSLLALSLVRAPAPSKNYMEFTVRNGTALGDGRDVALLRERSQLTQNITGVTLRPTTACLFLIPHPLMSQWETYVEKDTTLRARFIKRKQDACADDLLTTLDSYDAIFMSSTMYATARAAHPLHAILWKRVFVDEADSIHISHANEEINGLFYWFISASWMNLLFARGCYFNMESMAPLDSTPRDVVDRVKALMQGPTYLTLRGVAHNNIVRRMTGFMGSDGIYSMTPVNYQSARLVIHASPAFVRTSFAEPDIRHSQILCATPHNIRVLNDHISLDMLERLNAGDVKGALDSLGMSAHSEEEVTKAVTESLLKDLDHAQKTYEYKQSIPYSSDSVKAKALEVCQQKIVSIQSRISAIEERIKKASSENCPICYCDVSGAAIVPCCQQVFCFACLCTSLSRSPSCPLCRARIDDVKTVKVVGERNTVIFSPDEPLPSVEKPMSKKDAFVKFVRANKGAKILMFSSYDATFGSMERDLDLADVRYATLNGSNARISKLLKDFGEGKYTVLFLNARNMGAGLNIDVATHVVLYHKMNAELENQIVGRAVRLGRSADLDVIHLVHENEVAGRISHA
jgi:hypothetical protein